MRALDANLTSLLLYPNSRPLFDYRSGLSISEPHKRLLALIDQVDQEKGFIVIPTPALAEALVPANDIQASLNELKKHARIRIEPFSERAAIELAIRVKQALNRKEKRDGVPEVWEKVRVDRQIIAIAFISGATEIYSTDKGLHTHAGIWGIVPRHLSDVSLPHIQESLIEEDHEQKQNAVSPPTQFSGSGDGHPEGEARTEASEARRSEGSQGKQAEVAAVGKSHLESKSPTGAKPAGDAKGSS